jgi:transposase
VRLVRQLREETGEKHGAVQRVARQLDFGVETVRKWVNQADIDDGMRPGTTAEENAKIRRLEQEVRELRRANEILRTASAFFAAELDRPQR